MIQQPIKILQIGLSKNPGGIENCILNYYRHIDKSKIYFDFVDMYGDGLAYSKEIELLGGKIFVLKNFKRHPIRLISSLNRILKENNYDIVHINMLSSANILPAIISCLHKRVRVILHSHNSNIPKGLIRKCLHYLNILILRSLPTEHYACGEKAGKWLFGKDFSKENIIPNAIDIDKFKPNINIRNEIRNKYGFSLEDIVTGFVGRLCEQKNVLFLPEILEKMRKENLNCKMLIVGDGPLRGKLEEKINELDLKEYIILTGTKKNINEHYQAMDIFVLPSLFEGLPVVAIEAQTAGLPCFLSDNISNEVIICNTTKISLKKSAQEWAEIILEKTKNFKRKDCSDIIKRFGFDIKNMVKKMEQIYICR